MNQFEIYLMVSGWVMFVFAVAYDLKCRKKIDRELDQIILEARALRESLRVIKNSSPTTPRNNRLGTYPVRLTASSTNSLNIEVDS